MFSVIISDQPIDMPITGPVIFYSSTFNYQLSSILQSLESFNCSRWKTSPDYIRVGEMTFYNSIIDAT